MQTWSMFNCFYLTKRILLFFTISGHCIISFGNDHVSASVITLDPGNEIYSVFGHTAIRITDDSANTDKVYNFGTFNYDDPWFYLKFIRGNLDYFLSVSSFDSFIQNTQREGRRTYEQALIFSPAEVRCFSKLLENTYRSPERYYRYDFFHDNCATRVRDYISRIRHISYDSAEFCCKTFRQLLQPYITDHYWLNLGIDLALGKNADAPAAANDYMFLPVYIQSILNNSDLVASQKILLQGSANQQDKYGKLWPWAIFIVIALSQFTRVRSIVMYTLLSTAALTGIILAVLGMITENEALTDNWNILWTLPALFVLVTAKSRFQKVVKIIYLLVLMLNLAGWNYFPQELSCTFIPWMSGLALVLLADILSKTIQQYRYSITTFLKK